MAANGSSGDGEAVKPVGKKPEPAFEFDSLDASDDQIFDSGEPWPPPENEDDDTSSLETMEDDDGEEDAPLPKPPRRRVRDEDEADDGDDDEDGLTDEDDEDDDDPDDGEEDATSEADALRERLAASEREIQQLRSQQNEDAKKRASATVKRLDEEVAQLKKAMSAAHEEGESEKIAELTERMTDAKIERGVAARAAAAPDDTGSDDASSAQMVQINNSEAQAWAAKHSWVNNRSFQAENHALIGIAQSLVQHEGYDPSDQSYYDEIERRMQRRFPKLMKTRPKPKRQKRREVRRVAPVSRDDPPAPRKKRKGRKILTQEDIANMQEFGLDPRDPEVAREYAKNIIA